MRKKSNYTISIFLITKEKKLQLLAIYYLELAREDFFFPIARGHGARTPG
jgi:hypothetical protein